VICRFEHEALLGTVAGDTLQLRTDSRGLDYTCDVAPTTDGDNALVLIGRNDIRQSSFSFQCLQQEWRADSGGVPVRHLVEVRLVDVAPVCTPAYEDASVALRSLGIQFDADPEEVFDMARDNELSKFFVRTDNRQSGPRSPGTQALKRLAGITADEKRRKTWHQRQVELYGLRWDTPMTDAQEQVEALREKSSYEKRRETEAMYRSQDDRCVT
jgi:HK97 family phage prohead protease